jgi:hypothetical protein
VEAVATLPLRMCSSRKSTATPAAAVVVMLAAATVLLPWALGSHHELETGISVTSMTSPSPSSSPSTAAVEAASPFSTASAIARELAAQPCSVPAAEAAAVLSLKLASHLVEKYQEGLELAVGASRLSALCNRSESPPPQHDPSLLLSLALHRVSAICMFWLGREQRKSRLIALISQALDEGPLPTGRQLPWVELCRLLPADLDPQLHVRCRMKHATLQQQQQQHSMQLDLGLYDVVLASGSSFGSQEVGVVDLQALADARGMRVACICVMHDGGDGGGGGVGGGGDDDGVGHHAKCDTRDMKMVHAAFGRDRGFRDEGQRLLTGCEVIANITCDSMRCSAFGFSSSSSSGGGSSSSSDNNNYALPSIIIDTSGSSHPPPIPLPLLLRPVLTNQPLPPLRVLWRYDVARHAFTFPCGPVETWSHVIMSRHALPLTAPCSGACTCPKRIILPQRCWTLFSSHGHSPLHLRSSWGSPLQDESARMHGVQRHFAREQYFIPQRAFVFAVWAATEHITPEAAASWLRIVRNCSESRRVMLLLHMPLPLFHVLYSTADAAAARCLLHLPPQPAEVQGRVIRLADALLAAWQGDGRDAELALAEGVLAVTLAHTPAAAAAAAGGGWVAADPGEYELLAASLARKRGGMVRTRGVGGVGCGGRRHVVAAARMARVRPPRSCCCCCLR